VSVTGLIPIHPAEDTLPRQHSAPVGLNVGPCPVGHPYQPIACPRLSPFRSHLTSCWVHVPLHQRQDGGDFEPGTVGGRDIAPKGGKNEKELNDRLVTPYTRAIRFGSTLIGAECTSKATPVTAIVSGLGFIYFGLFYRAMGIFPYRERDLTLSQGDAVLAAEDPVRFRILILVTLATGVGAIAWGLLKLVRR
jgi:hypothetical protein